MTMVRLIGMKIWQSQTCLIQAKGVEDELQINSIIYNNLDKIARHLWVVLTRLWLNAVLISYPEMKLIMKLYGWLHQYLLYVIILY